MIQCDRELKARKPDIFVANKNERRHIPGEIRVSEKEKEKIERYQELRQKSKECGTLEALRSFQW